MGLYTKSNPVEHKNSRYEKIAIDIAYSIIHGEWKEGQLIRGRSTLSGKYSVSPETIRRALKLLEEARVVKVLDKKGVVISSVNKAKLFVEQKQDHNSIMMMKERINRLISEKRAVEDTIMENLDILIEQALIYKHEGVIRPLEILIPPESDLVGKSIGEIKFWEMTGATIIAVKRNEQMILSPGPKTVFNKSDVVFYVGNQEENTERVERFINKNERPVSK